jgi:hypothetical protein
VLERVLELELQLKLQLEGELERLRALRKDQLMIVLVQKLQLLLVLVLLLLPYHHALLYDIRQISDNCLCGWISRTLHPFRTCRLVQPPCT